MNKFIAITVTSTLLTGCATNPRDITPAYVSTAGYSNMTCEQLRGEAEAVSQRAAAATGAQERQQGNDAAIVAVGAVLFWPALFFIGGNKAPAAEISRLKGEMLAIEEVNRAKNCGIRFAAG